MHPAAITAIAEHLVCNGCESYQIWWNNTKLRPFKVINFGTNRKLICNCLLVINTNLPVPFILHHF